MSSRGYEPIVDQQHQFGDGYQSEAGQDNHPVLPSTQQSVNTTPAPQAASPTASPLMAASPAQSGAHASVSVPGPGHLPPTSGPGAYPQHPQPHYNYPPYNPNHPHPQPQPNYLGSGSAPHGHAPPHGQAPQGQGQGQGQGPAGRHPSPNPQWVVNQAKVIMETQLFSNWCDQPGIACLACCFPAILATLNQLRVEGGCAAIFTFCCYPLIGGCNRTQIKKSVGAFHPQTDSLLTNFCLHCFCGPCALTQEYRAVDAAILQRTFRPFTTAAPPPLHMNDGYPGNPPSSQYPGNPNYPNSHAQPQPSPNMNAHQQPNQPQQPQYQPQQQPQPQYAYPPPQYHPEQHYHNPHSGYGQQQYPPNSH